MSFWFFKFSKKPPKNLTNFCPRTWKVLKSSKQRQCLILLQFTYDYMDYLMYLKTFLLWFDHFLDPWAEICQIFRWFFGKFKKSKRHSEIIWPLMYMLKNYLPHSIWENQPSFTSQKGNMDKPLPLWSSG